MSTTLPYEKKQPYTSLLGDKYPGQYSTQDNFVNSMQATAYIQGIEEGKKDKEIEIMKMGKALCELAFDKISQITSQLIKSAEENNIVIYAFYLNFENWDSLKSLLIVKQEDFTDDKIEALYKKANNIAEQYNGDSFHWDYLITYDSENLNKDRIASDGYQFFYEHTPKSRQAQ
jgi:hypothetical protein